MIVSTALLLLAALSAGIPDARAMLPEEMTGEHMDMPTEEMRESDVTTPVSVDASHLVCVRWTDPATGAAQLVTMTIDAASKLGATNIVALGPCQSGEETATGGRSMRYGVGYLPEAILHSGVPQSVLQTVMQVIFSAFYTVLNVGGGGHRLHT